MIHLNMFAIRCATKLVVRYCDRRVDKEFKPKYPSLQKWALPLDFRSSVSGSMVLSVFRRLRDIGLVFGMPGK